MPVNKKQIIRLIKLVAELRENRYPNAVTLAEKLRRADLEENLNIACDVRTIQRDIKSLRDDFGAPIVFDRENNGYRLVNRDWEFQCPVLEEEQMLTLLLGARIAEDIMPPPLKNRIRRAMDEQLTTNNSQFLDTAFIDSLIMASVSKVTIEPEIFRTVFSGWQHQRSVEISYGKAGTDPEPRLIDPQALSYHNTIWYTKAYCHRNHELKVFAIHRIRAAKLTPQMFEFNPQIVRDIRAKGLFDYPRIENVRLHCQPSTVFYLREQALAKNLKLEDQPDGSVIVTIPSVIEHELLHWVLGEAGAVQVLSPPLLVQKVLAASHELVRRHS